MKKSRIVFPVLLMLVAMHVQASNIPPVAVLTSTPNQTWFQNLEDVVFSSTSSYDTDGYVNYTRFFINGVQEGSVSHTGAFTRCFALHGSPAGDCYQLGQGATTVTVGFQVRDNQGAWSSVTSKTYTIREHKGRKYFLTDHIGNVRATVNRDGNVLGYDDYYPYGLVMPDRSNNTANPNDNYKFTGYELDDEAGVDLYHAGNRMYDPVLGRFMQIDRFYFKYPSLSTYQYTANNPINFIDINGDSIKASGTVDEIMDLLFSISQACECKITTNPLIENEDGNYSTTIAYTDIDSDDWDNLSLQQQIVHSSVGSPTDMIFRFTNNSEVALMGGAQTRPNDDGDILIEFARGFHDNNWDGMTNNRAPVYRFVDTSVPAPNSKLAWWLTGKSEAYSATGLRRYGLNEAVAHEIVHINDYMLGHIRFGRRALENNAIEVTNKWRKRHGIPPRSY